MSLSRDEYRAAAALRTGLRRFSQASQEVLRSHGLTSERYELLLAIKHLEGREESATVSALTSELGLAQVSVSQLVRRAENAGLLLREVSQRDARVRYIRLTASGEDQLREAVTSLRGERAHLLEILDSFRDPPGSHQL